MSSLYYRSGKFQSAVYHALEAKQLLSNSNNWQEALDASVLLMHLGEDKAALECLSFISPHEDANIAGAADIGRQYQRLENHGPALEWLVIAENNNANLAQVAELRGMIYMFDGDLASSELELEKSIAECGNTTVSPHFLLSMLGGSSTRIDRLSKLVSNNKWSRQDLPYLNYALFKELDSLGREDQAWEFLEQALAFRQEEVFYSCELESIAYDDLINATKNMGTANGSVMEAATVPLFIVGMPRSGTSLLESMLADDSNIAPCGELKVMRNQIQFVLNKVMANPFDQEFIKAIPKLDYVRLGSRYMEKACWKANGKPYFIDKNPGNFNYVGLILQAIPNAKIINLVRNPMDVCFSNLKEIFGPNYYTYSYTQEGCANHYRNYKRLMSHWHQIFPGKILDVAYENLVSLSDVELKKVQEFCGLTERTYLTKSRDTGYMSNSASTVQIREPIHKRNLNGWYRYRKYLTVLEEQLQAECLQYEKTYLS